MARYLCGFVDPRSSSRPAERAGLVRTKRQVRKGHAMHGIGMKKLSWMTQPG